MATIVAGMDWFKQNFGNAVTTGLAGTPYSLDLLTAIAVQESFDAWGNLFARLAPAEVLKACVGDTIDGPSRSAFPTSKADLIAAQNGDQMFDIARQALESLGSHSAVYHRVASANPNKFCHAFGIFQYDIQFFPIDSEFFLQRQWFDFGVCLEHAVRELDEAKRSAYGPAKQTLTDREMVYVAIAYNHGRVNTHGSFAQGYFDHDSGKFYGELIADYMATAHAVKAAAPAFSMA